MDARPPHRPPSSGSPAAEADQTNSGNGASDPAVERLRELLFQPEKKRLDSLQHRLEDPEERAEDIALTLADAVRRASRRDQSLAVALRPLLEQTLAESIKRNPAAVAEAIFPILGPAIRRAVSNAFRGMVESLNRIVEQSFTWRGLKWRWEAWRTGRSVAEVALKHSVVYRVEQVFLIHRESGLPLVVVGADEARQDPDLVSSMLTAIQDFVHDSFSGTDEQNLDRLEVGDFQVWIERGPRAVLAAVIRGSAPRRVRDALAEAVDAVHREMSGALERFQGDVTPFEQVRPHLENCLEQEFIRPRKKISLATVVALGLLAVVLGAWAWRGYQDSRRWQGFLAAIENEPGLIVTETGRRDGRRFARVLRDPLASDPAALLASAAMDGEEALLEVRPFISSAPELVEARARTLLAAPNDVQIRFDEGVLRLSGEAPADWIRRANEMAVFVPGVSSVWLDRLADADRLRLEQEARRLEAVRILFEVGSTRLAGGQQPVVEELAADLRALLTDARDVGLAAQVRLLGSTDDSGAEQLNRRLREARSERLRSRLIDLGVPAEALVAAPAQEDVSGQPAELRSVLLRIDLQSALREPGP